MRHGLTLTCRSLDVRIEIMDGFYIDRSKRLEESVVLGFFYMLVGTPTDDVSRAECRTKSIS